ncbi:MAG: glycosyltransferase family 2 protein [Acidobacteriaceae bacterium]|nr:glycosyltransferase family 2 protein [Acidobacteriaceae bacterium]
MIGVVIVTYNSGEVIGPCLDSCKSYETVVVDNASSDTTLQEVRKRPWVQLIPNVENRGFAAAVNQGVECFKQDLVLLLNPDVVLLTSLDLLERACARPDTAAACGLLVDSTGQPQHGFSVRRLPTAVTLIFEVLGVNRLLPFNPVNRRYRCLDLDLSRTQTVQQPAGAFLLFRRDVWEELGGFDARFYPLWFEDVDFCRRIAEAGMTIQFIPEVRAQHRGGHSVTRLSWSQRELYWYGSLLRYAAKYLKAGAFRAVCLSVAVGSFLRIVVGFAQTGDLSPLRVYKNVIHLAFSATIRAAAQKEEMRSAAGSSELRKVDVQRKR